MANLPATEQDRARAAYIEAAAKKVAARTPGSQERESFDHEELAIFRQWAQEKSLIANEQLAKAVTTAKGQRESLEALWGLRVRYYDAIIEKIQRMQEQLDS